MGGEDGESDIAEKAIRLLEGEVLASARWMKEGLGVWRLTVERCKLLPLASESRSRGEASCSGCLVGMVFSGFVSRATNMKVVTLSIETAGGRCDGYIRFAST